MEEVQILLRQARGLPIRNMLDASSDPYCVFSLVSASGPEPQGNQASSWGYRSKACKRTLNPQWNLNVPVPTAREDDLLKVPSPFLVTSRYTCPPRIACTCLYPPPSSELPASGGSLPPISLGGLFCPEAPLFLCVPAGIDIATEFTGGHG